MEKNTDEGFRVGYLINRATRLMTHANDAALRKIELATAQLLVLVALKDGVSRSQKELAAIAQIDQSTMAQLLSRMERDGLIQYAPDLRDKRSRLVSLTPKAIEKMPEGRAILLQRNEQALKGFDSHEVTALSQLLQRVVDNLETDEAD